jgi:hypothetical protein
MLCIAATVHRTTEAEAVIAAAAKVPDVSVHTYICTYTQYATADTSTHYC